MKKQLLLVLFGAVFTIFCTFCKKPNISATPVIKFVAASQTTLTSGKDSLKLTISYRDGDGDLGENDPDVLNCFVQDSRSPALLYQLRILQLAPTGSKIAIEGELGLEIPPTGLLDDTKTEELAVFSIKIMDRAGNMSNMVESPSIRVVK
jgi:hypothetical protein